MPSSGSEGELEAGCGELDEVPLGSIKCKELTDY